MKTWVMRKMGDAFDPERHCPYTGLTLFPVPSWGQGPGGVWAWGLVYWREDGHCFRCRSCTPEEAAWAEANRPYCEAETAKLLAWLRRLGKLET